MEGFEGLSEVWSSNRVWEVAGTKGYSEAWGSKGI
jgi:hypothetical protein